MGIYVLILALTIMFIMAYFFGKKDILSPFVIVVAMYLLSSLIAGIYMKEWQFSLSYFTVILIITALFVFGIGELIARKTCDIVIKPLSKGKEEKRIDVPIIVLLIIIVVFFFCLLVAIQETYALSVKGGNTEGYSAMMTYARKMTLESGYSRSRIMNHMMVFTKAVAFILGWVWINNFVYKKIKLSDNLCLVAIAVSFGIQAIASASRGFAIDWVAYFCLLYFLKVSKANGWKNINPIRIIILGVVAILTFMIIFVLLGLLANRFGGSKIIDTIAFYLGMSIPSLDHFVKTFTLEVRNFGEETLYGIYAILNKFELSSLDLSRHLEFVDFNGVSGNVYTSLRRYIHDYGYIGLYIVQFYIGVFYGFFYNLVRKRSNEVLLVGYSVLAYSLVMQGIDEILISNYISISGVNLYLYMLVAYFLIIKLPKMLKNKWTNKKLGRI